MGNVLVGALVAGLFGLVGALVARRSEHQRWLRAEQLEATTHVLDVLNRAIYLMTVRHGSDAEATTKATELGDEVLRAATVVQLLMPADVARFSDETARAYLDVLGMTADERRPRLADLAQLRRDLTARCRRALDID